MPSTDQIKLLISLAQIDGSLEEKEKSFIKRLGKAGGIGEQDIEHLFFQRHPLIIPDGLNKEERFDYLYTLIQLMKIDERMLREELLFCCTIATNLGYNKALVLDLLLHADDNRNDEEQRRVLMGLAERCYNGDTLE